MESSSLTPICAVAGNWDKKKKEDGEEEEDDEKKRKQSDIKG